MTKCRRFALSAVLAVVFPIMAIAGTTEFRVLFDADNDLATGCTVGGMAGVEQVLVTKVTDSETSASVTRTHRQVCTDGVLGDPIDIITTGWPAGWSSSSGQMLVETRIPFAAFGSSSMPGEMRLGLDGTRGTGSFSALTQPNGDPILFPTQSHRRRAVGFPGDERMIVMDGIDTDWGMISPLTEGTAGSGASAIKLIRAFGFANPLDSFVYFNFNLNLSGSGILAVDDSYTRTQGVSSLSVDAPGVLENDQPNTLPLTAAKVSEPFFGTVTLNPDGSFVYSPSSPSSLQVDSFQYKAKSGSDESNAAVVRIKVLSVNKAPVITTAAADATVCNGATATFTAAASGPPPPTVQWSVSTDGGVLFTDIPGATTGTLSFVANTSQNGNQYRATFTNSQGSAQTTATLTVTNPPAVTTDPVSQTFCAGSPVTFTAAATATPAATVQWQVDGGSGFANMPGETSTTLTFVTATSDNGKQYRAVFTNACGSATTTAATLTVNANPATPVITTIPGQVCANSAGNTASGPAGATTYAWSIVNGTITSATNIQNITYNAGASGTVDLTLVVTNASGCSATNTANVTINANPATPTITPAPAQVCASSTGNTAAGPAGATTYAWSIVNGTITSATNIQTITYTAGASGTVDLTLVVTNASGCSATNTANVTINANPAVPAITPTPAQVCASSTGNTAAGPAGATTYAWSIVNGTITSATNIQTITYTAGASGTVDLTLVVTNAAGCSATNTSNVTINANPATPTITPTPAQVCGGSTGNTADGPAGATTYAWSIVNGTISSATNIQTITYTAGASGTVDLTLVVTNASGCTASNTVNVTINPSPATPTITPVPAQVCANSTGNVANGPAGATTYAWSIVNGTITSATNIQNITYTAGASGTVDLTLVVTNASACPATNTVNVTINANPATPTITPNPAQVCANSTGNTADGPAGATTYAWSIVNGTITSAANIQTITYTAGASGTVDLTLVVTNAASCSATNTVNVTINANPAVPTITPTPAAVCEASTGNTADGPAGATTYAWSIVNGTITSATNIQTITYTAGASGTVDLTLVVTNAAGCSATNTVNVTINPSPAIPTITPTPSQVCANSVGNTADGPAGATTYAWSIVNGTITSATNIQTITYTAGPSGTVDLTLVVTNAGGCPRSNTVNVTINANPTSTITPTPASVCASSTGNSAAGPAGMTTYAWSIVNGTITSATNIQTITYDAGASGTVDLTLVVTNAAGCSDSATVNVTIDSNPATPTITPTPAQVCANSTGNTASGPAGATTYAWSIVNGTITSATNIQTITYTAGASGTVDLTLTVTNGPICAATNTVNVTINANPATPTITPTPAQVCANSTGNSASGPGGATTYAWSIVNGTITSAANIQTITYTAGPSGTVDLTLTVTNVSGCPASNTVNVTINANPATPTITPTPAQVCANSTGNTADGPAGATTYAWSIVNGTITSATNIQTITYTAGASGTVDLTLVVTNPAGCPASNTVNVTINANPATPTITPTPTTLCPNSVGNSAAGPAGATTYAWSIVNGTITSATNIQTVTYDAGASGTVDLTLVVTNAAGCSATNTVNVAISNVAPAVTTDPISQSIQAGNPVTFTVAASGTPSPTVQWELSTDGGTIFNPMGGETNTSLTFTTQLSQNGNQYRAVFTNLCGTATTNAATLTVTCPTITAARTGGGAFPAGIFNTAYNGQSFTATGGTGPYTFAVTGGTFATGLNLASDGTISSIPTATGTFNFTVTATDTVSNCTGSQAFSISIAPSAVGNTYGAGFNLVDNTQFVITGGTTVSPSTPFVGSTTNILTNDLSDAAITATAGTFATSGGGSVTIASDGTFIYTPKANPGLAASTSDSFTYTAVSNGVTSAPATVSLTLANRVWYVKNDGGGSNGQSQSPFTTLAAAQAASLAGDIIYVYNGDGTTLGHTAGITLKNTQQLIGEGVALVVNTVTLVPAGIKPQITNLTAASDAVTLAGGNTVKGLNVTGATRDGISGNNKTDFTGDTLTVQNNTGVGVDFVSMGGTLTITNSTISTVSSQALKIDFSNAGLNVDNTNTINGGTGTAVTISNRAGAVAINIGAAINNGQIQLLTNSGSTSTFNFTGTQTLSNGTVNGITMTTNTGTTTNFSGTLNVTTTTGIPFQASGGGTLNITGTANITAGAAANGVSLNGITIGGSGVTFTSVNTTGATTGINLVNFAAAGNVTVNGGTISGGTTGVSLQGTNTSLTLAGVTITGPATGITNTTNFGTLTIGASVNVSAAAALNLNTGTVTGMFNNVSSTGGTNGVSLNAVAGTWGATAGSLTGASSTTFLVQGGSGQITWGSSIDQANGADAVRIQGSNSTVINFNANVTTSATSTGINLSGSSGTYNFNSSGNTIAGSGGGVTIGSGQSGTISFAVGTAITTTGTSFTISGTPTLVSANITYSGTITHDSTGVVFNIDRYSGTLLVNGTSVGGTSNGSVTSTLSNITGTVTINNLSQTSNFNTFVGTLVAISGTNTGGSITFNNLDLTATGSAHDGKGLVMSGGGTLTITATGGASTIDVGNTALDLNGVALGTSAIGTLNSLGDPLASGVVLTNVTGGTLTIGAGAITGNTAAAFLVSGGTVSVTDAGTIAQATAAQPILSVINHTTGTLTFNGAVTATNGTGIQFDNADGTYNFNSATNSLAGGDAGVDILNGSSGTFAFVAGMVITNPTGTAFNVNASTPASITYPGNITANLSRAVSISHAAAAGCGTQTYSGTITGSGAGATGIIVNNCNAGTIGFTGTTLTLSTQNNNALTFTGNNGATINLSGGNLSLTTVNGHGVTATGGGTVNITGNDNTITTTGSGTAFNWAMLTGLHSNGTLRFKTINKSGSGAKGIVVNYHNGTFEVTGDDDNNGVPDSVTAGGTVTGTSQRGAEIIDIDGAVTLAGMTFTNSVTTDGSTCGGAMGSTEDNLNCTAAIHLVDTSGGVTLRLLSINGSTQGGINGNKVTNLTMTDITVQNAGDEIDEHGIAIKNLLGTGTATNLNLHDNESRQLYIVNANNNDLTSFTITNSTFANSPAPNGGQGILLESHNAGTSMNVTVDNGLFQNLFTNAYQVAASTSSTQTVSIINSTFTNVNSWMVIQASGGTVNYSVQNNDGTTGALSGSGAINLKTDNGGTLTGDVTSNLIGSGAVGSGAVCGGGCSGLFVNQRQGGSLTANIVGNTIRHVDSSGIFFSGGQDSSFGAGKMNVVITGNLIQDPDGAAPAQAIAGQSGIISGDVNCLAATIGGLTVPGAYPSTAADAKNRIVGNWDPTPGSLGNEIFLFRAIATAFFRIPGLVGGSTPWVTARNEITSADGTAVFTSGVTAGTCP